MAATTMVDIQESLHEFTEACQWFAEQAAQLEKVWAVTAGWHGDYVDLWTLLEPWDFETQGKVVNLLMQLTPRYPTLRFDFHVTTPQTFPQRHVVLFQREAA
jgi:hypothetical protein